MRSPWRVRAWAWVCAALLAACADTPPRTHAEEARAGAERLRAEAEARFDRAGCLARGGTVRGAGLLGLPVCELPFPDAGRACTSRSDCQGLCLVPAPVPRGARVTGACQATNVAEGCRTPVDAGMAGETVCVD